MAMTPNKEDYLKKIYRLGGDNCLVSNKQIAAAMQIAPASVTEMLIKLGKEGLIQYEPYKGSRLTKEGMQKSIPLLRGHRLWEVFLLRHLGYSWSEAHEDAELLEHVTPTRLAQRLDEYLSHPSHCPHGSAIPQQDGQITAMPLRALNRLNVGETSHIRRVTEEKELLDYLQDLGIKIGCGITILSVGAYEGPITLDFGGRQVAISHKAACQIYVDENGES